MDSDSPPVRDLFKACARGVALAAVTPALISYVVRSAIFGRDRALEGSSQALSIVPGLVGEYLRRAFLARTLADCAPDAVVSFGTVFSKAGARLDAGAYVGAYCTLGLVHIERDVLIASGVHITSGRHTHGTGDPARSIRSQPGETQLVRIGAGAWIGSGAVVMADVGARAIVGAGAVVTEPIPDAVLAAGVPARVMRPRES
jgi:acetyltransferase-like isoleucine patch superfamily enzyme